MKLPCEIVAKELLPSIRSAVVFILYNEYNLTQTEIAKRMGITQASVNQYIQKTRGKNKIILDRVPGIEKKLRDIAEIILSNGDYLDPLCNLCRDIRNNNEFYKYLYRS